MYLSSHHVDVHQRIPELEFPDKGMRDGTRRSLLGHHPAQGGTLGEEVTTIRIRGQISKITDTFIN